MLTVVRLVERPALIPGERDGLQKHFRQHHGLTAVSGTYRSSSRATFETKYRKSRRLPSPMAAPTRRGACE